MTSEFLLEELRDRDIRLSIEGDRLVVDAPCGALNDELRERLRDYRDELFTVLTTPGPWARRAAGLLSAVADLPERFEHRAAVCEYDGGLSRDVAERVAFAELQSAIRQVCDSSGMIDD